MNDSLTSFLFGRLLTEALPLLVYLTGIVLALVWMARHPLPATFCLAGCAVLLLTTVAVILFQYSLLGQRLEDGMTNERYASNSAYLGYGSAGGRALGVGLLVAAALAGRSGRRPTRD